MSTPVSSTPETSTAPAYKAPVLRKLGSVEELTERFNKTGSATDQFSAVTGLGGSLIEV